MAVKLTANYSKKLGLPGYSSHSFGASVEVELTDLSQVEAECTRLYQLLQQSIDREIQSQPGFVPDETYGIAANANAKHRNGNGRNSGNGNGHPPPSKPMERWNCTEGQRGFILRILNENSIPREDADNLATQFFGLALPQLNKLQASQIIEELLAKAGKPARQSRWHRNPPPSSSEPQPAVAS